MNFFGWKEEKTRKERDGKAHVGQKKASEGQQEDEMAQRHDGELEKGTEKRKNIDAVQSHRKEEKRQDDKELEIIPFPLSFWWKEAKRE